MSYLSTDLINDSILSSLQKIYLKKNELLNLTMKCRLMQQKHFNKVTRYVGAPHENLNESKLWVERICKGMEKELKKAILLMIFIF